MLRRIFTLVMLATMVVGYAQAQFSFGAKAGFNLVNIYGSDVEDVKMKPAFQAGLVADYSFIEAFAVQAGVMFAQQGWKVDNYLGGSDDAKINLNYIQIPINAMYKFSLGSSMKLFAQAGPYLGFGLGGKVKVGDNDMDIKFGDGDDIDKLYLDNAFDFGLGVGVGLQYNSFQLGVGYNFGLLDLDDDTTMKNGGLAITLTFLFM
ncbi:MAG: PorT family protein [Bacteroidales bacterium]|jgi:hypothetical protein|nr:PorT family protein [Bacteroidales bacterium]